MEVRLMLNDQAGRAAKDEHGGGSDCWGSAQKKEPREKKQPPTNPTKG